MPKFSPYRGSYAPLHNMDRDHGIPIWDSEASLLRFPTGALRRQTGGDPSHTLMAMPPTDEKDRQKLIVKFWTLYCDQAADEFVNMKNILVNSEQAIASVNQAEEELQDSRKVVRDGRRKLKEAENELLRIELGAATVKDALQLKEEQDKRAADAYQEHQKKRMSAKARLKGIRI